MTAANAEIFACPLCDARLTLEEGESTALDSVAYHVAMECPKKYPLGTDDQRRVFRTLDAALEPLLFAMDESGVAVGHYILTTPFMEITPYEAPERLYVQQIRVGEDGTVLETTQCIYRKTVEHNVHKGRSKKATTP